MWWFSRRARRARLVERSPIPTAAWREVIDAAPVLWRLSEPELARLHDLTVVFLHEKAIEGCGGLALDDFMRRTVASQACLLVLALGIDAFAGVDSVLVYPAGFRTRMHHESEHGVVTVGGEDLLGEAWADGPVVLNWEDVEDVAEGEPFNLVLHEFAHKLDMLDGWEDGVPPLHRGMDAAAWRRDFEAARDDVAREAARGIDTGIDPYAAEDEAEGFAVFTETFFCAPELLSTRYPEVFAHLRRFYLQDPGAR